MTDKDTKDMTASELLRWAANGDEYISPIDGNSWTTYSGKLKSFVEWESGDWPNDARLCDCLADKIDAELAQARTDALNASLRSGAELWAKANGWPGFREGEDFGAWLNRCALKLPCDKDGEPWHIDDRVCPSNTGETTVVGYIFDKETCYLKLRWCGEDGRANDLASMCKRPAPEALGADGLPVVEGETVWLEDEYARYAGIGYHDSGCLCGLAGICANDAFKIKRIVSEGKVVLDAYSYAWCPAKWLTHTPPDTQQQIDEDVAKSTFEYWGCQNAPCGNCPALVGGEKPFKRFGTEDCQKAMVSDLLRRQRELDKRTEGAE